MKRVLIPIANGTEEMEAVIMTDTLRRAQLDVTTVSITSTQTVTCSRGVVLVADALWVSLREETFDAILIPGGAEGAKALASFDPLLRRLQIAHTDNILLGAICAGPLVLQAAGLLNNHNATCHPSVAPQLTEANHKHARVVEDRNLITSQGPGTSFEFALAVIRRLQGVESAASVAAGLILP